MRQCESLVTVVSRHAAAPERGARRTARGAGLHEGHRRRRDRRRRSASRSSPTSRTRSSPASSQARSRVSKGAAKYINAHGGLAGRKVVVDFIDSHLSADDARNADHQGVRERLRARRDVGAVPQQRRRHGRDAPTSRARPTGIPDLPLVVTEVVQQCSPVSFPDQPPEHRSAPRRTSTRRRTATTRHAIPYFQKKYGKLQGLLPRAERPEVGHRLDARRRRRRSRRPA